MTGLANKYGALNLSQGFPDFNCSPELIELVNKAMRDGHNQYAPMPGLMALREAIAEKTERLYNTKYNPDTEITVVPGATYGIYAAITSVVKEGDEVIIFEPAYDCYEPAIQLSGGKAIHVELRYPDYKIDWEEVKKVINFRTRMIIINSPHNPSGSVITEEGIKELTKIVSGSDIIILSDEVYEHIIYDGMKHCSIASVPELAERSMVVSSFGKTYHTTGWKVGYIVAPALLTKHLRKVHQFMFFSVHTPSQVAYAEMIRNEKYYLELHDFYQKKRDLFIKLLTGSKFKVLKCSGTYFQLLGYELASEERDVDFAKWLTIEKKIAAIPISVFYRMKTDNKVLRFCFAKSDETIEKACEILCKI